MEGGLPDAEAVTPYASMRYSIEDNWGGNSVRTTSLYKAKQGRVLTKTMKVPRPKGIPLAATTAQWPPGCAAHAYL